MNFDTKKITEAANKAGELQRQLAVLDRSQTTLQAEKSKLTEELQALAPVGMILDASGKNGDAETDARLEQIARLNTRLDLLPGIRARVQRELTGLNKSLAMDLERAQAEARRLSREKFEAIRADYEKKLLTVCGGDSTRAAKAADAIVQHSEAFAWYQAFKQAVLVEGQTVAARLLGLLNHIARFQAGETVRAK